MTPVHSIKTMSDEEITKLFISAQKHVKDVHSIESDHDDFDKFLKMHPFYNDAVTEYRERGLDKKLDPISPLPEATDEIPVSITDEGNLVPQKSTTLNELELQQECKLTEEEIAEGQENLKNPVPEGSGETTPVSETPSSEETKTS